MKFDHNILAEKFNNPQLPETGKPCDQILAEGAAENIHIFLLRKVFERKDNQRDAVIIFHVHHIPDSAYFRD